MAFPKAKNSFRAGGANEKAFFISDWGGLSKLLLGRPAAFLALGVWSVLPGALVLVGGSQAVSSRPAPDANEEFPGLVDMAEVDAGVQHICA